MFWGWVFCPSVKSRANVYTFVKKKISCSWMDSPWDLWRLKGSKWWEVLDRVCFSLWSFACVISCVLAPKCHFFSVSEIQSCSHEWKTYTSSLLKWNFASIQNYLRPGSKMLWESCFLYMKGRLYAHTHTHVGICIDAIFIDFSLSWNCPSINRF